MGCQVQGINMPAGKIQMMANLYWYDSFNFGDMLSPYLLSKILECDINSICTVEASSDERKYVITGSILSVHLNNAIIFGAGFVFSNNYFRADRTIIAGVRGNLSLKKILSEAGSHGNSITIIDDAIIGEPSLILPEFYYPVVNKEYKLGVIPHLFDYERAVKIYGDDKGVIVIDLRRLPEETLEGSIERVIAQILQCDQTISSSLHGLIVSVAYGIPTDWCEFNTRSIIGDRFKFYDFLESVTSIIHGNEYMKPIDIIDSEPCSKTIVASNRRIRNEKIKATAILDRAKKLHLLY